MYSPTKIDTQKHMHTHTTPLFFLHDRCALFCPANKKKESTLVLVLVLVLALAVIP